MFRMFLFPMEPPVPLTTFLVGLGPQGPQRPNRGMLLLYLLMQIVRLMAVVLNGHPGIWANLCNCYGPQILLLFVELYVCCISGGGTPMPRRCSPCFSVLESTYPISH